MKTQAVVEYGEDLQQVELPTPTAEGAQVVIEVTHCGVCHSDVHFHDGHFDFGEGQKLDLTANRKLPMILGHEIEGTVVGIGPDVKDVKVGQRKVIFPWIGCGDCPSCARGEEQLCNARALGVNLAGGFSSHCLVPHERYCLNADGIDPGLASTYMCSGITAYSALKYLKKFSPDDKLLIVGLGGVGMMGLQFALAMFDCPILVADLDESKLKTACDMGAHKAYNPKDPKAIKQVLADTNGGAGGIVDFVGAEGSLNFANAVIQRGGEIKVVGLFGGMFKSPIPLFPLRGVGITGSMTGNLADTIEMLEIVKSGKVKPIPLELRDMCAASHTLTELREGKILGRVVLTP